MTDFSTNETFAWQFGLGLVAGFLILLWYGGCVMPLRLGAWLDVVLGTLAGGLVGARSLHVLLDWDYFGQFPADILDVWRGGLSWHGAVMGGLLGALLMCWLRKVPFPQFSDGLALAFPFGLIAGWGACRGAHCAYGRPAEEMAGVPDFLTSYLLAPNGEVVLRLELQVLGMWMGVLLLTLAIGLTWGNWQPGLRLWLVLFLGGLSTFLLGYWRDDDIESVLGMRQDQVFDLGLVFGGALIGMGIWSYRRGRGKMENTTLEEAKHILDSEGT